MSFEIPMNGLDRLVVRLVYAQQAPLLGRGARWLLRWRGTDIDPEAAIGTGLRIRHCGTGIVVHPSTRIGANAVLTTSTGPGEIWAGSPARKVADRSQPAASPAG